MSWGYVIGAVMKKTILVVLDGCGLSAKTKGNAFRAANPKNFDYLWDNYPHSSLVAGGKEVGLPEGQMGNSEVGHMNIGAGRIVYQPLELINSKIEDKSFYEKEELIKIMDHSLKNKTKLHIFGLLSDGGVHSHIKHLQAIMKMAKEKGLEKVYYHVFLDGRDTLPNMKEKFVKWLEAEINQLNIGKIATICGRYYAMDRDNRWDRIKLAYDAVVSARGTHYEDVDDFILDNREIGDEFVKPSVLCDEGTIEDGDALLVFNFRPDRVRELFSAITNPEFNQFAKKELNNINLVTLMPVSDEVISTHAFEIEKLDKTFGTYISSYGLKQLRIAETEKYAHVTYFFDGGVELNIPHCDRHLIPSSKVATYDLAPNMSAREICEELLPRIQDYDFILLNFANGDMVGHTGVFEAAAEAIKTVDECLGKIYKRSQELGFTMLVTADHGNCEEMLDEEGNVLTAHSTNPVPFIITDKKYEIQDGKLADIAPTLLEIIGLPIPIEMTGQSLIKK